MGNYHSRSHHAPLESFDAAPYLRLLGEAIRKKREALKAHDPHTFTQANVGAVVGLSKQALANFENGRWWVSQPIMFHLAHYLDVQYALLFPADPDDPLLPLLHSLAALPAEWLSLFPTDPAELRQVFTFLALPTEVRRDLVQLLKTCQIPHRPFC
jgi:transcriptional regulator with XRE-family HTH domain